MRGSIVAVLFDRDSCACERIVVVDDANVGYGTVGDAIDDVLVCSWGMMTESMPRRHVKGSQPLVSTPAKPGSSRNTFDDNK